jgi:UDP-N-acetylglucosamine 2-epimerase (non-hydrolysing)
MKASRAQWFIEIVTAELQDVYNYINTGPSSPAGNDMFDSLPSKNGGSSRHNGLCKILVLFGTRPEAIKLAPVIHELRRRGFQTTVVCSSQHKKLLQPFLATLKIDVDHDLGVMKRVQNPNEVCARVISRLDKILTSEDPEMILVQGDTTTALAGAIAGFNRKIPVGHVEAGLRSGNLMSPFPEEMNRRMISQIATLHFAATEENKRNLRAEHVPGEKIYITGNTVVDSLQLMLTDLKPSDEIVELIRRTDGKKRLLVTTHRRESFGTKLTENLRIIGEFADKHSDVCVFFPVHPNPNVKKAASDILGRRERIHLLPPIDYPDFLAVMQASWLIVSDSGGVQEEAPSLGKPLLILRENTERPEAVTSGVARLVGTGSLKHILEQNHAVTTWIDSVRKVANPFGDGHSANRIVRVIEDNLRSKRTTDPSAEQHLQAFPATPVAKMPRLEVAAV